MEEKNDRRIRRTKNAIKNGLLSLLKTKPINQITVRELCDLVDINRGTFYLHYADIYYLLETLENELYNELEKCFSNHPNPNEVINNPHPLLSEIFSCFSMNFELTSILLGPHGDPAFVEKLKKLLKKNCEARWKFLFPAAIADYYAYFSSFVTEGYFGLIKHWIQSGMKETPKELVLISENIIFNGINMLKSASINEKERRENDIL
ncbi:MAG: TetR/AcrR family transcriptional regulator [Lachnospiraceae bacterium]|nr:TetR/AcrR family transcriptional regulator [Lachnospiraceae bacterium]